MKSKFIFNGISSEDMGLVIQAPPTYTFPERNVSSTSIPGKNGNLIIDNKSYKNVARSYSVGAGLKPNEKLPEIARKITEWLMSMNGKYVKLEDTYEPDIYRLASYSAGNSFTNVWNQGFTMDIKFDCKPQCFLKEGDTISTYNGTFFTIYNPYIYEALPLIKISNLPPAGIGLSKIYMLTVRDEKDNTISSVTLTDIQNGVVNIDSENQNCFDNIGNINEKIGLNSKPFPYLVGNETKFMLEHYEKKDYSVDKYNSVIDNFINEHHDTAAIRSLYKPLDALINSNQEIQFIKSYKSVIDSESLKYRASAYQAYLISLCDNGYVSEDKTEIADSYTFISFNTLLANYGQQFSFSGKVSSDDLPDWLTVDNSNGSNTVKAGKNGYYMSTADKQIIYRTSGTPLMTSEENNSVVVNYYPCDESGNFVINYTDLPSWLTCIVNATTDNGIKYINKIRYIVNSAGYCWSDKTWIFGSANWNKYTGDGTEVLTELTWNNLKKAFVSSSGLNLSTTTSYTYRYINKLIQYQREETGPEPSFTVSSNDNDISHVRLIAKNNGWFNIAVNGGEKSKWIECSKDEQMSTGTLKGTDAFNVEFIDHIPLLLKDDEDWPSWLSRTVEYTYSDNPLNSTSINFKLLKKGLYKWSKSGTEINDYTDWIEKNVGDDSPYIKTDSGINIVYLSETPKEYNYDRKFTELNENIELISHPTFNVGYFNNKDEAVSSPIPFEPNKSYQKNVIVTYNGKYYMFNRNTEVLPGFNKNYVDEIDIGSITVRYYPAMAGYFKWDNNVSWQYITDLTKPLFSSLYKDDSIIYYLEEKPEYPVDIPFQGITLNIIEDSIGNFTEVDYICQLSDGGYIKVNSDADWVFYKTGDIIYKATVGEMVRISKLEKLDTTLDTVVFEITPHWWKL